ncbi:hypothetical protein [uncultured Alistipes sp.]|uniref:hypothetical protein n=1 Tax=uncultured Alistipes sp. TaxID=538949 RepID=UPI0025F37573|nr:hypothetical protein [uncultured Alistipes sp.]
MLRAINKRNIAAFFLILMCVQYMPVEGFAVSYLKFGAMCLSPLLIVICSPKLNMAWFWAVSYCVAITFLALFNSPVFRPSTILYLYSFVFMFLLFYNLVNCEKAFTLDFYIKLVKGLILAYFIVLVLQQAAIFFGFRQLQAINLMYSLNRGIWGNSLALEPSHAGRILCVAFLALLRLYQIKWGPGGVRIGRLFRESRWVCIGFLWSVFTMGSGTAFVGLGIICLYFVRRQYVLAVVPAVLAVYLLSPLIDYPPLNRAVTAVEIVLSDDPNQIVKKDGSAAVRIKPIINTFTALDLSDKATWVGEGIDASHKYRIYGNNFDKQMVGGINNYGLIGYILGIILIAYCCLIRFFSLETLLLFVLVGLTVNNFAYAWGIYMLLVPVKYFYNQKRAGALGPGEICE